MKQGTSFILPVWFDYDLSQVKSIDFIFKQPVSKNKTEFSSRKIMDGVKKAFSYPSDVATLSTIDKDTINLYWTQKDTYKFNPEEPVYLDTRINLKNSIENPETEIIEIEMLPTLFKENEEI